jgi:hypothetical protein
MTGSICLQVDGIGTIFFQSGCLIQEHIVRITTPGTSLSPLGSLPVSLAKAAVGTMDTSMLSVRNIANNLRRLIFFPPKFM